MSSNLYTTITENLKPFIELKNSIIEKETPVSVHGLASQAIGLIASNLQKELHRPLLVVAYDPIRARKLYEDFQYYMGEGAYLLHPREIFFFDRQAKSNDLLKTRLEALHAMIFGRAKVVVTTMEALQGIFQSPERIKENIYSLTAGDSIDLNHFSQVLQDIGYERVDIVEGMGQYSVRGGILDIFGPDDLPYRIELFDIEVDSIRTFDPISQRSIDSLERVEIVPVQDALLGEELLKDISKEVEKDLRNAGKDGDISKTRAEEKFLPYLENLKEGRGIENADLLLPYIPLENRKFLAEYFDTSPLILLDEPRRIEEVSKHQSLELANTLSELAQAGEILKSHLEIQMDYFQVKEEVKKYDLITLNSIVKSDKDYAPVRVANFSTKTVTSFNGRINQFEEELRRYTSENYKILLLGGNEEKTDHLISSIKEMGFPVRKWETVQELTDGVIYVDAGSTHGGFEINEIRFVLLNSAEIYGKHKSKKKSKKQRDIIDLDHLHYGDYVVHEAHGIGQFMGTTQLDVQGTKRDYLSIQYKGGDKLFIPMDQLSIIHRHSGSQESPPKINRLNSTTWQKTKARAKKSVEEMADDLIALYARRESAKGYSFAEDTPWQRDFESSFEYEETQGQLDSIDEIKKDMEKDKPMDRLLCADVGYGKTEVALRAAFKAIMDGKQAAILVPTTILAQQHYNTIMERFSAFPVRIGLLSRFRTSRQIKDDIEGLRKGNVDLVIGTHRLLSNDVKFKDLGLLIIDEEQRFGVRHKEKLKLLKENIDTLTLTATPIPRTLQMSMAGIRDMSIIDEPPESRFPIQTYVVDYNDIMVREAILKEIERGGQVYFVYNRVQSMESMLYELRKLVPEAEFAMANGQMGERLLEDTMLKFVNREIDVLVCSTIIETGMDVSNANTMIIYESNRLGLSQLYQLRGRIGRGNRIAYAYFTYKRDASISEVAEKRLRAISEFTEFGSGYKIALRDLEIRGSGNILGESQHGHMDAIGYDLYIKLLRKAVGKLKGEESIPEVETSVDVYIDAFLPKAYIRNEVQRMEMYRKIAVIEDDEEEEDIIDELIDRFGDLPRAVLNLLRLSKLRHQASKVNIESIVQKKEEYSLEFVENTEISLSLVNELTHTFGKRIVFSLGEKPSLTLKIKDSPLRDLEKVIELVRENQKENQKKSKK